MKRDGMTIRQLAQGMKEHTANEISLELLRLKMLWIVRERDGRYMLTQRGRRLADAWATDWTER